MAGTQSTDRRLLPWLQQEGHDATAIARDYPHSLLDLEVLDIARREQRLLITEDRDFGELVFRLREIHSGVIFLRLPRAELSTRIQRLEYTLTHYADQPASASRFLP